jgi:hypothetical protein
MRKLQQYFDELVQGHKSYLWFCEPSCWYGILKYRCNNSTSSNQSLDAKECIKHEHTSRQSIYHEFTSGANTWANSNNRVFDTAFTQQAAIWDKRIFDLQRRKIQTSNIPTTCSEVIIVPQDLYLALVQLCWRQVPRCSEERCFRIIEFELWRLKEEIHQLNLCSYSNHQLLDDKLIEEQNEINMLQAS